MGHLTRAVALARAAVRRPGREGERNPRTQICLVTNSPFANGLPVTAELGARHRIVTIDPNLSRDETAARVNDLLQTTPFDVLVVDTFPRGLGGELTGLLPDLTCHKVLVHRDLNPRYITQAGLSSFANHFDRLLVPGESAPFETFPHAVRTAPWLIRDDHELLPPTEARRMLGVETDTVPIVAVIGCGRDTEVEQMRCLAIQLADEFTSDAAVRFLTLRTHGAPRSACGSSLGLIPVSLWPFLQAIRGVSVIVGGGGYNTVHEARATGTRLIGLSRPRLYDRQERRLKACERATSFEEGQQHVAAAIASESNRSTCPAPRYQNGVHEAIETIESLVS